MEDYKKKYEEALEKARQFLDCLVGGDSTKNFIIKERLENAFKELKESEDEKIRKEIISYLKGCYCAGSEEQLIAKRKQWIAWLKKQGEKIDVIENFDTEFERQISRLIASTINKEYEYNEGFVKWTANALLNYAKHEFEKQGESCYPYQPGWRKNYSDNKPKVKHSVLMLTTHGIAEGEWLGEEWCQYRWSCKVKDTEVLYWMHLSDLENLEKENEKQGEQKPAWSEEDERNLEGIINEIEANKNNAPDYDLATYDRFLSWLKSLKDRVQPNPKQEWSEEDKKLIDDTCNLINTLASGYGENVTEPITLSGTQMIASIKYRLRALVDNRPQSTWSPSDEQMDAVRIAAEIGTANNSWAMGVLKSMYQDLKKLRG